MGGSYAVVMGREGRLAVPPDLCTRAGLTGGSALVLIEADEAVLLLTQEQAKARVRSDLAGQDLVAALLSDRREEAARDNRLG